MARLTTSRGASSAVRVIIGHEAMAVAIDQVRPFAANGFGDQRRLEPATYSVVG